MLTSILDQNALPLVCRAEGCRIMVVGTEKPNELAVRHNDAGRTFPVTPQADSWAAVYDWLAEQHDDRS